MSAVAIVYYGVKIAKEDFVKVALNHKDVLEPDITDEEFQEALESENDWEEYIESLADELGFAGVFSNDNEHAIVGAFCEEVFEWQEPEKLDMPSTRKLNATWKKVKKLFNIKEEPSWCLACKEF